jgi:TonB family protein
MTAGREIHALVASVAVHVLVLTAFMLVREPTRELPPVMVLRLSLPPIGGVAASVAGVPEPVAEQAARVAAEDRPAAASGGLPALVTPHGRRAAGALGGAVPSGTESASTVALPDPGAALAAALAAADPVDGAGAAQPAAAATELLPPHIIRSGLPAVERGIALPYPQELIRRGIEADVEIRLTVAVDGTVVGAEVVRSSGVSSVDAEVAQALRQFLFASSGDSPVTGTIRVSYRLERGF